MFLPHSAGKMLENINLAVDPCENFYDFACGGWMNKTVIPEYKSQFNLFEELAYHVDAELRSRMKMILFVALSIFVYNFLFEPKQELTFDFTFIKRYTKNDEKKKVIDLFTSFN